MLGIKRRRINTSMDAQQQSSAYHYFRLLHKHILQNSYSTEITRHININTSSARPARKEFDYFIEHEAREYNRIKREKAEAEKKEDEAKKQTEEDNKNKDKSATETSKASSSGGT